MSDEIIQNVTPQSVAPAAPTDPDMKQCAYYTAFTEEEKTFYEKVRDVEALDDEIVMLRVKIFALVVREPENMTLLLRSLLCLDRLCRTNIRDYKRDALDLKKMKESTIALLRNYHVPPEFIEKKFH
jgi:hypothetical protein